MEPSVPEFSRVSVAGRALTDFEHVLLGLICQADSSGYDLKRAVAATPLGVYRPSSGALYPALRRLERRDLVRALRPTDVPARARRVLQATTQGRAEHASWVREPVNPETIGQDFRLHLMRFVMMESLLPPAEILAFLYSLRDALETSVSALERYRANADLPGRHPRLALDHGVDVHRASLAWVNSTIHELTGDPVPSRPSATHTATDTTNRIRFAG